MTTPLPDKVSDLRMRHQVLRYESYSAQEIEGALRLSYRFTISPNLVFTPTIEIPSPSGAIDAVSERLVFLIGMVELLSYWKSCCPEQIEIAAGYLSPEELPFWENLIRQGLGEFFYLNQIPPTLSFNLRVVAEPSAPITAPNSMRPNSYLVLVGGGKDSIVTLELMRGLKPAAAALSSLVVNPIEASLEAIKEAGYPAPLVVKRRLDPQIKQLNAAGYLNGHTPFSALLSFISALVAYRNNFQIVLSSNEASASEGNTNYLGFEINHQYSKSLHYEELFRRYLSQQNIPVNYLSFLRPLNELQICGLFSALKQQHAIFRSCNREQTDAARARLVGSAAPTRAGWCAKCPKCVFTYLCLRCFLSADEVKAIFGVDPSELGEFTQLSRELAGLSEHKPFECVGTFGEVQTCLTQLFANRALSTNDNTDLSDLRQKVAKLTPEPLTAALKHWNRNNFLSPQLAELVSSALANVTMGSR